MAIVNNKLVPNYADPALPVRVATITNHYNKALSGLEQIYDKPEIQASMLLVIVALEKLHMANKRATLERDIKQKASDLAKLRTELAIYNGTGEVANDDSK